MEQLQTGRALSDILAEVTVAAPQIVKSVRPANSKEQKAAFLAGEIDEPHHDYEELRATDFAGVDERLEALGAELQAHPDVSDKARSVYAQFIQERRKTNRMLYCAAVINNPNVQADEKAAAEQEYTALNRELYGEVDQATYATLAAEKLRGIEVTPGDTRAQQLLEELRGMLPTEVLTATGETYRPSDEVFETVRAAALMLYENLVRHVPDRDEPYNSDEIGDILETIVREEFGESAAGWLIVKTPTGNLEVKASQKEARLSESAEMNAAKLRSRIVHELGVHMMRAIRGGETDMLPMELGLAQYAAAEEGLGMVMQQAFTGEYELPGVRHYITAGFMAAGHGFHETFEMKWRLAALETYKSGKDIDEEAITSAQKKAYDGVMRIARGTDRLPMLKDLSYYDGAKAMWEYFEQYADDEFMLNLALLGKIDPSKPEDIRTALESRNIERA